MDLKRLKQKLYPFSRRCIQTEFMDPCPNGRRFIRFFHPVVAMSFLIITFVIGLCLSAGAQANAALLVLASALVGLACLAQALGAPDPGAPPLWAFVEAWLTVATLQLGYLVGAAGRTIFDGATAPQSMPAQDESGS